MSKINLIVAVVFSIFAVIVLFLSAKIPVSEDAPLTLGTPMFPRMLSYTLLVLSVILFYISWNKARTETEEKRKRLFESGQKKIVGTGLGIMILCTIIMIYVGFIPAMILMNFLYMLFFKVKSKIMIILEPFLTTLTIFIVFKYLLNVPLPEGILVR